MNRLLRRSFAIAVVAHLGLIASGGALAPRFGPAAEDPLRTIDVGLESPEPPAPVVMPTPPRAAPVLPAPAPKPAEPAAPANTPTPSPAAPPAPAPMQVAQATPPAPVPAAPAPAPNGGGFLNTGTPDPHGDVPGLPAGGTPVGVVPSPTGGAGSGSGTGPGVGPAEPPHPAPPPAPPPPRKVALRVCAASHLRPNPYCPECVTIEFTEGTEPQGVCTLHKAPPPPPRKVAVRVCAATRLRPNPWCPNCITVEFVEGTEPRGVCALHKAPPPPVHVAAADSPPPAPHPVEPKEEPRLVPAKLLSTVKPEYPRSAVEGDREGAVSLKVEVRADGTAGDVEVIRSSGSRILDAAAVKAVKRWRWDPARKGAEPVASTVRCKVRFALED